MSHHNLTISISIDLKLANIMLGIEKKKVLTDYVKAQLANPALSYEVDGCFIVESRIDFGPHRTEDLESIKM